MAGVKIHSAEFLKSWIPSDRKLLSLPQIAFAGRSNVGKSSLINALLNRKKLAQKSKTPGKTRKVNFFEIKWSMGNRSPSLLYFVDLPGYGFARISRQERKQWERLLTHYFQESEGLKLTILILDSKVGLTDLDRKFIGWYSAFEKPLLLVANKGDKLKQSERQRLLNQLSSTHPVVLASATDRFNINRIWASILEHLETGP